MHFLTCAVCDEVYSLKVNASTRQEGLHAKEQDRLHKLNIRKLRSFVLKAEIQARVNPESYAMLQVSP